MTRVRERLLRNREAARHVVDDLMSTYEDETLAAAALRSHAERVPYRQAALIMLRLADNEQCHADALATEITALGRMPPPVVAAVKAGTNHWHRVAAIFHEADAKRRRCIERAILWNIDHPVQATVFASIAAEDRANRRLFEELLARADSLAID